jgi:hypothetical protein
VTKEINESPLNNLYDMKYQIARYHLIGRQIPIPNPRQAAAEQEV